jgi:hypothetical protein
LATKNWHPCTEQPEVRGKTFIILFFSCRAQCLAQGYAAEVERWRVWRGRRTGRRGRRRAFRRIAVGRGARTKSGLRRQEKVPGAEERVGGFGRRLVERRGAGRREGWASGDLASKSWAWA